MALLAVLGGKVTQAAEWVCLELYLLCQQHILLCPVGASLGKFLSFSVVQR